MHGRTRTPFVATVAATLIIRGAALALAVVVLAQLTSAAILIVFALVNLAAIRIKRRQPARAGAPEYPVAVPVIALGPCVLLIAIQGVLGFG